MYGRSVPSATSSIAITCKPRMYHTSQRKLRNGPGFSRSFSSMRFKWAEVDLLTYSGHLERLHIIPKIVLIVCC